MKIVLECIYSFIGSFLFGIIFNIRGKKLFFAGLGGLLSQTAYVLLAFYFSSEISQYFFATIITAIYSEVFARIEKAPATVFLVPSIIPLVPGGMMYYSMEKCISGNTSLFINMLFETLGVAGALAMGILLVSSGNKILKVAAIRKNKLFNHK